MAVNIGTISDASKFREAEAQIHFHTTGLLGVIEAFLRNVDRLHVLSTLPTSLFGLGAIQQSAWDDAVRVATENTRSQFVEGDESDNTIVACLPAAVDRQGLLCDDDLIRRHKALTSVVSLLGRHGKDGLEGGENFIDSGLSVFLAAQVMLSWTVFETTAGDLLITAANLRTNAIGKSLATQTDRNDAASGKSLKWEIIEKHKYDLNGKLGTIFSETLMKKRNLDDLKATYKIAFPQHKDKLDKIFERKMLVALFRTRNVMAHQGGRADKKFIGDMGGFRLFRGIAEGDQVEVTAKQASHFSQAAIDSCIKLIELADNWLRTHPN